MLEDDVPFFPRWDILVSWRVFDTILPNNLSIEATFVGNHWATNMFRYHVQAILGIGFPYISRLQLSMEWVPLHQVILPRFNIAPEKWMVGRQDEDKPFLFGWYIFRGYVNLPRGNACFILCMVFFPFCFYSLEVHNGLGFRDKMGLEADRLGDILMHTMFESSFNHQLHQPYTP